LDARSESYKPNPELNEDETNKWVILNPKPRMLHGLIQMNAIRLNMQKKNYLNRD
jgi:hypothetical protein